MEILQAQINLDVNQALQQLVKINTEANTQFGQMSKNITDALGKIDGKNAGKKIGGDVASEGKNAGKNFGEMFQSQVLASLVASGIKEAFSKIFDFGKSFFKASSQMEDFRAEFGVLLGTAEKGGEMLDKIFQMAGKTPFETDQLAKAGKTLLQYRITGNALIGTLMRLGDVSGGNADRMNGLAIAYGQASSAGKANMGDINQMINNGFNPLNEILKKTGETMSALRKRVSLGRVGIDEIKGALISATSQGGPFFEMMDKKSRTVSGRLSTLSDQFKTLGMAMLGMKTNGDVLAGGLFDTISKGIDAVAKALGKINWTAIGQGITNTLAFIGMAFGKLVAFFRQNTPVLIGIIAGIAGVILKSVIPATFAWMKTTFMAMLPMIGVFAGIAAAVGFLVIAWQNNFGGIQEITWSIFGAIGTFLSTTMISWLEVAGNFLKGFVKSFNDGFVWIQVNVLPIATSIFVGILRQIGLFVKQSAGQLGFFVRIFGTAFQNILNSAAPFIENFIEYFFKLWDSAQTTFAGLLDTIDGVLNNDMRKVVEGGIKVFGGLAGGVASVCDGVVKFVGIMVEEVIKTMVPLLDNWIVKEGVKLMGGDVGFIDGLKNYKRTTTNMKAEVDALMNEALNKNNPGSGDKLKAQQEANKKNMEATKKTVLDGIKSFGKIDFNKMGEDITKGGADIESKIAEFGKTLNEAVKNNATKPFTIDVDSISKGIDSLTKKAQEMSKALGEATTNFANDKGKGLGESIKSQFDSLFNSVSMTDPTEMLKKEMENMENEKTSNATKEGSGKSGGGGGGGGADKAKNEAKKQAEIQKQADQDIALARAEALPDGATKDIAVEKAKNQAKIDDFKGTEQQKAEYAKAMNDKTAQDILDINKKYNDKINSENEKNQKEAKNLLEKKQKENEDANDKIRKAQVDGMSDQKSRELEMAKFKSQNELEDFKGTEQQKTQFALAEKKNLEQEFSEINKKFNDKDLTEKKKQQEETKQLGESYDKIIGQMSVLNQKQQEYTDKTKESTKIADSFKIQDIKSQLAQMGTKNFGFSQMAVVNDGNTPTNPQTPGIIGQPQTPQNQPQTPQTPQNKPQNFAKEIDKSFEKTNENLDKTKESLESGLAKSLEKGADALKTALVKMDEQFTEIANAINENWIKMFTGIGGNIPLSLLGGMAEKEQSLYDAISALSDNALFAVKIERRSREEFGEKGRGASSNVGRVLNPNVELMRNFKPYSSENKEQKNENNSRNVNISSVNISNNQDFDAFKGKMNGLLVVG